MTPASRIVAAVAAVTAGTRTETQALVSVSADDVEAVMHAQFEMATLQTLCTGVGASPGAAVGRVCLSADAVFAVADRGESPIFVASETGPADEPAMRESVGLLTARGGLASHAALVARGWGIPAVCGAEEVELFDGAFRVGTVEVREGDLISLDGSSGTVMLGEQAVDVADAPAELETLLQWADEVGDGRLAVRANADTGEDATRARELGATGIGLCRTEHMFLGERLPLVQAVLLAPTPAAEEQAMQAVLEVQRDDFAAVLAAMDGLPVTVRLLDPPLHEFLPPLGELLAEQEHGTLTAERAELLKTAAAWQEQNPMLGTRGVRLAVLRPQLYRMQVRALLAAATDRRAAGGKPVVEIMVPLVVSAAELAHVRAWIDDEVAAAGLDRDTVLVGTMIETPRAALVAGPIAEVADFVSFGTNDLTQMTFGFSRDDIEGRLLRTYIEQGLLPNNPFQHVDPDSVGRLVMDAVAAGRAVKPGLKAGVCGEHGGDPASIELFLAAGLDYVSCSAPRVPGARLAAAHAVLRG